MAHLLGGIHRGAYPGPLPVDRCAHAFQALQSETQVHERTLPLAPTEPPCIDLVYTDGRFGVIEAPSCPPASSCSVSSLQKRVKAGRAAAFVLAPPADAIYGDSNASVITTLAALVQISVELQQPDDLGVPPAQLPADYEASIAHGGVRITLSVPASAPEGSRVVISRVSVAGCDVALGEAPLEVIVGFNHAPAPDGPVMAAAESGDVPALLRLLNGGASTEEKNAVSGRIRR
jgi:hypothetical protein